MEKKIAKHFFYEGLGFPIHLVNVPMIKSRGEWTPDIDYNYLQRSILISLSAKPTSLTGNEIRFVRKYFKKTLEAFGKEFGVSHVAVLEWEKEDNNHVKMNPATEKCIRLFILDELHVEDNKFRESYHELKIRKLADQQKTKRKSTLEPIIFDVKRACG